MITLGIFLFNHQSEYRIRVFPNDSEKEQYPITYIQWNSDDTDTIKCEYRRLENAVICTKVWFNEKGKWDESTGNAERYFKIVK
jgi:hypothetical protein